MPTLNKLHGYSNGNFDAITFIRDAYAQFCNGQGDEEKIDVLFDKMKKNNLDGYKLYMFWNDCCKKDTILAVNIMEVDSIDNIRKHIESMDNKEYLDEELIALFENDPEHEFILNYCNIQKSKDDNQKYINSINNKIKAYITDAQKPPEIPLSLKVQVI